MRFVLMLYLGEENSNVIKGKSQQFAVFALIAMVLFFSLGTRDSQAAFELNFDPDLTSGHSYSTFGANCENYSINMSHFADSKCNDFNRTLAGDHDDGTAAFQRVFTNGGKTYYHVIIGDYQSSDTFLLEYYIEATGSSYQNGGGAASSSAYTNTGDMNCSNSDTDCLHNMSNPYGSNSDLGGTGTGNPTKVVMRMVLDDPVEGTYTEFLKGAGDANSDGQYDDSSAYFDKKPMISQKIDQPGVISAEYSLDMRDLTYSSNTPVAASKKVNQTFILEGVTAANQGDYDSTGNTQTPALMTDTSSGSQVVVSGGAFTYSTSGSANGPSFGDSFGDYTYYDSQGANPVTNNQPYNRDYSVFCSTTQNTVDWSGNGVCQDANGGSAGGRGGGGWGGW